MQRIPQTTERFPAQRQTRAHGGFQPMLQGVQMAMQPLPAHARVEPCQRLCGQP
jgi:hypothetical protein